MQSTDSIKTYAYGKSKSLVSEKEEIKCNIIKSDTKMVNFDDVTKENNKEHNPNLSKNSLPSIQNINN